MSLVQPVLQDSAPEPPLTVDDATLELLPAGTYVCSADGRIVRYNRKAAELWGRSPETGGPGERFCGACRAYGPDGRSLPAALSPMAEVLRTGLPARDREVVIERPDRSRVAVMADIEPILNADGEVTGAVSCFRDIAPRRDAQAKRHEGEALLRAVIETTPECIKVVAPDGALLQMNSAGLRMIEADGLGHVQGACTYDLIAPEHRPEWLSNHQRVCGGESLAWEFDIVGLAGTRRHMETHAVPLALPDGRVAQLAVTRDITFRKQQEDKLRDSERHARELLEALPAAVYTTDASGALIFYNESAVELWGREPDVNSARWCGSPRLLWPDGAPMAHDECPMAVALREDRAIRGAEAVVERVDGSRVPFMAFPTPLHDCTGALVGAVNMLVDISDRKRAEEHQRLLINELNHRVKNTLATVQSIVFQTLRGAASMEQAREDLESRLIALSRAHDILTRENWESASLLEIVARAVEPYRGHGERRFDVSGPDVRLAPRTALALAMALQELATNAVKYGALSNATGRIHVTWKEEGPNARQFIHFRWEEADGPPVERPKRRGFGTRLMERSLAQDLDGNVRIDFAEAGVVCTILAPL